MCCASSDAKRQHVELVKDRRMFDQRITKLKDECEKLMISKFGRIVDLEELDTVTVNQQLEEVKDRLSVAETERAADLRLWDVRASSSSFIIYTSVMLLLHDEYTEKSGTVSYRVCVMVL